MKDDRDGTPGVGVVTKPQIHIPGWCLELISKKI
jgi:hypothetical protein